MDLKSLLNRIVEYMWHRPKRQHMQDAGDSNVQIGCVQGDVINQGSLPEINIHIHGASVAAEASISTKQQPTANHLASSSKASRATSPSPSRVIDPPEIIALRRSVFDWLAKFDQLHQGRSIVYKFMREEFGTNEVMKLDWVQLIRADRWCAVVYENKRSEKVRRKAFNTKRGSSHFTKS